MENITKRPPCSSSNGLLPSNRQELTDSVSRDVWTNNSAASLEQVDKYAADEDYTELRSGVLASGWWVGPMDPGLFLDRFLPRNKGSLGRPDYSPKDFSVLLDISDNQKKYTAIMYKLSNFSTGLEFLDTHCSRCLVQAVVKSGSHPSLVQSVATVSNIDFSEVEFPIMFKDEDREDPFSDDGEDENSTDKLDFPFECDDDTDLMRRGQIVACFASLIGVQLRVHAFAVLICGKFARLLRWDPNGVVVSKKFAFAKDDYLVEFLWRYSMADDRIRGHDPTVRPLPSTLSERTKEEAVARVKLMEANQKNHREFRTLMIPDRDTNEPYEFIISHPLRWTGDLPFGRMTRPMLAFDIDKNALVFVKDYWRSFGIGKDKEGEIYRILHAGNVPYISQFGRGNDVEDHGTVTDLLKVEDWAYPSAETKPLRHYRMSLETIGRLSNTFSSSHEFVTAVADAMEAHEVAFYDCNILHRDISAANILITEEGRGMLIDWDLCLNMNNPHYEKNIKRTGTAKFLSAMIIRNGNYLQGVLDDKESFLYVLLWHMMVYTPYNTSLRHTQEMELFDEDHGASKMLFLLSKYATLEFQGRPSLTRLLSELGYVFNARYAPEANTTSPARREYLGSVSGLTLYPYSIVARERKLVDRSWMVKTLRRYLEPRSDWPVADKPRKNPPTQRLYRWQ